MTIQINGLTRKQVALMDILWNMHSDEQVNQFVRSLPRRDAQDCQSLMEIVIYESMEQDGGLEQYAQLAHDVIDQFRN